MEQLIGSLEACRRALRDLGITFSSDVITALDVRRLPALELHGNSI